MDKKLCDYVTEKTNDLIKAESCCSEARAAGQAWLKAAGTEKEAEETKKYIAELEEDIEPIDDLIAFAESSDAVKYCGEDGAKELAAHARRLKADGAEYCDCPACMAAAAILGKKKEMLG